MSMIKIEIDEDFTLEVKDEACDDIIVIDDDDCDITSEKTTKTTEKTSAASTEEIIEIEDDDLPIKTEPLEELNDILNDSHFEIRNEPHLKISDSTKFKKEFCEKTPNLNHSVSIKEEMNQANENCVIDNNSNVLQIKKVIKKEVVVEETNSNQKFENSVIKLSDKKMRNNKENPVDKNFFRRVPIFSRAYNCIKWVHLNFEQLRIMRPSFCPNDQDCTIKLKGPNGDKVHIDIPKDPPNYNQGLPKKRVHNNFDSSTEYCFSMRGLDGSKKYIIIPKNSFEDESDESSSKVLSSFLENGSEVGSSEKKLEDIVIASSLSLVTCPRKEDSLNSTSVKNLEFSSNLETNPSSFFTSEKNQKTVSSHLGKDSATHSFTSVKNSEISSSNFLGRNLKIGPFTSDENPKIVSSTESSSMASSFVKSSKNFSDLGKNTPGHTSLSSICDKNPKIGISDIEKKSEESRNFPSTSNINSKIISSNFSIPVENSENSFNPGINLPSHSSFPSTSDVREKVAESKSLPSTFDKNPELISPNLGKNSTNFSNLSSTLKDSECSFNRRKNILSFLSTFDKNPETISKNFSNPESLCSTSIKNPKTSFNLEKSFTNSASVKNSKISSSNLGNNRTNVTKNCKDFQKLEIPSKKVKKDDNIFLHLQRVEIPDNSAKVEISTLINRVEKNDAVLKGIDRLLNVSTDDSTSNNPNKIPLNEKKSENEEIQQVCPMKNNRFSKKISLLERRFSSSLPVVSVNPQQNNISNITSTPGSIELSSTSVSETSILTQAATAQKVPSVSSSDQQMMDVQISSTSAPKPKDKLFEVMEILSDGIVLPNNVPHGKANTEKSEENRKTSEKSPSFSSASRPHTATKSSTSDHEKLDHRKTRSSTGEKNGYRQDPRKSPISKNVSGNKTLVHRNSSDDFLPLESHKKPSVENKDSTISQLEVAMSSLLNMQSGHNKTDIEHTMKLLSSVHQSLLKKRKQKEDLKKKNSSEKHFKTPQGVPLRKSETKPKEKVPNPVSSRKSEVGVTKNLEASSLITQKRNDKSEISLQNQNLVQKKLSEGKSGQKRSEVQYLQQIHNKHFKTAKPSVTIEDIQKKKSVSSNEDLESCWNFEIRSTVSEFSQQTTTSVCFNKPNENLTKLPEYTSELKTSKWLNVHFSEQKPHNKKKRKYDQSYQKKSPEYEQNTLSKKSKVDGNLVTVPQNTSSGQNLMVHQNLIGNLSINEDTGRNLTTLSNPNLFQNLITCQKSTTPPVPTLFRPQQNIAILPSYTTLLQAVGTLSTALFMQKPSSNPQVSDNKHKPEQIKK